MAHEPDRNGKSSLSSDSPSAFTIITGFIWHCEARAMSDGFRCDQINFINANTEYTLRASCEYGRKGTVGSRLVYACETGTAEFFPTLPVVALNEKLRIEKANKRPTETFVLISIYLSAYLRASVAQRNVSCSCFFYFYFCPRRPLQIRMSIRLEST